MLENPRKGAIQGKIWPLFMLFDDVTERYILTLRTWT